MSKLKVYDGSNWKVVNGQVTGDTLPIGSIVPYGSRFAPTNWLICDGSAVSRTTYSELFAVIGTSFGSGDGSTTFNLPNLKGKVPVGYNSSDTDFDTMGETGGEKKHTLTVDEMPSHNHKVYRSGGQTAGYGSLFQNTSSTTELTANVVDNTGGGQAHNNLQPYQVVCYIIKAKQSAGVVANVSNVYSGSQSNTYSCNYINDAIMDTYSTTPQIIGSWINGDAIYRKVIDFGNLPNNEGKIVSSGITGSVIVTRLYGTSLGTGGNCFPLPYVNMYYPGDNTELVWLGGSNEVRITTTSDKSSQYAYVVVEYRIDY